MKNQDDITREGADTRHHSRLKLPFLAVSLKGISYPIIDFSLSGCGIQTGQNFSYTPDKIVTLYFSVPALESKHYLVIKAVFIKAPNKDGLTGLIFKGLSGGQKEILRYMLKTRKEGGKVDRKTLESLFLNKKKNDRRAVRAPRKWKPVMHFPRRILAGLFFLVVIIAAKITYFPSPYILSAERAFFVSASPKEFTQPQAGAALSLVSPEMNFVIRGQPLVRYFPQDGQEEILRSPCDCFIIERAEMDGKSIHPAGLRLFSFALTGGPVIIDAYIKMDKMSVLKVGMRAEISLSGTIEKIEGLIIGIQPGYKIETLKPMVVLKVRPDIRVPVNMIGKKLDIQFLF